MGVQISATNLAVPDGVQNADELSRLIDKDESWIVENTGVRTRHVVDANSDPANYAALAAMPIVREKGRPDLLISAAATVRQSIPDTSVFIHRQLKLDEVPCFSINATCLSFLTALHSAHSLINSGAYESVLICSSEIASLGRDYRDAETAALLGDGAASAWLEKTDSDSGMMDYRMKTWSSGVEYAQVTGGGMNRFPMAPSTCPDDYFFQMNGQGLLKFIIPKFRRFMLEFFRDNQLNPNDIDLVIPHQPSGPGLAILENIGFEKDKIVNIIGEYGNCIGASIPMALATASEQNRLTKGDRVLFVGTAAGVSIATALWKW